MTAATRTSIDDLTDKIRELSVQAADDSHMSHELAKATDQYAQELFVMGTSDRNAITEEIHGVTTLAPEESPEFLERALGELSSELSAIPDNTPLKTAYAESLIIPESYVHQPDFRLRFLRCELFDAKKAAIRMLNFLNTAADLFGPQVLQRPPQLVDFKKEELSYMRLGYFQILPFRDRAGRPIYAWVGEFGFRMNFRQKQKAALYHQYVMTNDVESQRKGAIKLMWMTEGSGAEPMRHRKWDAASFNGQFTQARRLFEATPLRTAAVHWCLPDHPRYKIIQVAYGIVNRISRARVRFHYGKEIELWYNLKSYGIPVDLIPLREDGAIKTKYWKQWMQVRKKLEQGNQSMILFPRSSDVLFRKGDSLNVHPGNSTYRGYIEARAQEHSNASYAEKQNITKSIIDTVVKKDGRFLEWNKTGWWMELDSSQIHSKVANQLKLFKFRPAAAIAQNVRSSTTAFQNQDHADTKRRKISHNSSSSDSESSYDCACFL